MLIMFGKSARSKRETSRWQKHWSMSMASMLNPLSVKRLPRPLGEAVIKHTGFESRSM